MGPLIHPTAMSCMSHVAGAHMIEICVFSRWCTTLFTFELTENLTHRKNIANSVSLILDRTRRAWVAPARDGRYVLGQLRSRTAGVSFLSFWDGVCRHNWNDQKIEKSRLF